MELYGGFGGAGSSISGASVDDLVNDPQFPDQPAFATAADEIPPVAIGIQWPDPFEETDAAGDNYGLRMRGYLHVPTDGEWKFFLRSDDGSSFLLNSEGPDPGNAEEIARVTPEQCCGSFVSEGTPTSESIPLEKGTAYYFEFRLN